MVDTFPCKKPGANHGHVAVIGDGVIGLLTSLELLQRGYQVTLFGRGFGEGQASWASGGILSPLCPWQADKSIQALSAWSCDLYFMLQRQLLELTGIDIELTQNGMLLLDAADQQQISSWCDDDKHRCIELDQPAVKQRLPLLNTQFDRAHFLPLVGQLRPLRLMTALMQRLQQFSGYQMRVPAHIESVAELAAGDIALKAGGEVIHADMAVVCAGAWTNQVLSLLDTELPIVPVKGQMLLLDGTDIPLDCIVIKRSKYLVPRLDGGILVGSTLEPGVDDVLVTATAESELRAAAIDLIPALADRKLRHQWAGVRPGSPHGIPYIGQLPGYRSVWVNAGHYRNGINMAPGSACLLAQLMCGETPAINPQPYRLNPTNA